MRKKEKKWDCRGKQLRETTLKEPHPGAQEAFNIRGKLPWHRQFLVKAKIEITFDEPVKVEPVKKQILHGYEENISGEIYVYSLEEIVAEKMRAILQHLKKLEDRDWSRSRARDYYDLWKILNGYSDKLKMEIIPLLFIEKCKVKDVEFSGPEIFFNKTLLEYIGNTWEQWLGPLVPDLPPFKPIINDLKQKIFNIFQNEPVI